ncbi:MAG: hypothetical protein ACXVPN_10410 [Bacteroidia bacterium]
MLKNKKSIYVVLPLVIAIWSYVGYQIYDMFKGEDFVETGIGSLPPKMTPDTQYEDTFVVFNNYKDPFLGESGKELRAENSFKAENYSGNHSVNAPASKNYKIQNVKAAPVNEWPQISYSGIIKNQTTSKSVAIILINGKTYTLNQGEEREGIKLLSFSSDAIHLLRGKEKRTFTK